MPENVSDLRKKLIHLSIAKTKDLDRFDDLEEPKCPYDVVMMSINGSMR